MKRQKFTDGFERTMADGNRQDRVCTSLTRYSARIKTLFLISVSTFVLLFCYQRAQNLENESYNSRNDGRTPVYAPIPGTQQTTQDDTQKERSSKTHEKGITMKKKRPGLMDDMNRQAEFFHVKRVDNTSKSYQSKPNIDEQPDFRNVAVNDFIDKKINDTSNWSKMDNGKRQKRLPKSIVIGFAKCGSYALLSFLQLHPDIECATFEVRFFRDPAYSNGFEWYRQQMPLSLPHQITMEKTPSYITHKIPLTRIHKYNSSIKLIVIVRDPVTRIQSIYEQLRAADPNFTMSFDKFVKMIIEGDISQDRRINYVKYISTAREIFSPEQILVVSEEDLEENPVSVMQEIEVYLNLRRIYSDDMLIYNKAKGFFCYNVSHPIYTTMTPIPKVDPETGCFPASKGRQHPSYRPDLKRRLVNCVQPYNDQLFKLIGKRFKWTAPDDL